MAEAVTQAPAAPPAVTQKPSVQQFGMTQTENRATEKVEMQRATAQVYASHQRAIQYPRDEARSIQRIYDTCANVNFAADAMYKVPRGNGNVEGLNVKAAKEFARLWGNLEYGTVSHGDYGNMSQFEAYSHDLETNVPFRTSYTVKHQRWANGKNNVLEDDQSIGEIQKARNSKEVRNAILAQIPEYVRDEAIRIVKRTLHQAVQNVPEAWTSIKSKFAQMGVAPASLCRFINKPLNKTPDCLDAADIVEYRFLYDAIKNDKSVLDEVFPERDKSKIPAQTPKEGDQSSTKNSEVSTTKPSGTATGQKSSPAPSTPASSSSTTTSAPSSKTSGPKATAAGDQKSQASQSPTSASTAPPSKEAASQSTPAKSTSNTSNTSNTTNAKSSAQKPSASISKPPAPPAAESSTSEEATDSSEDTNQSEQPTETTSGGSDSLTTEEQTDFSPTEESEESQQPSEEESQNPSDSEEESTQEDEVAEEEGDAMDDTLQDKDAF